MIENDDDLENDDEHENHDLVNYDEDENEYDDNLIRIMIIFKKH